MSPRPAVRLAPVVDPAFVANLAAAVDEAIASWDRRGLSVPVEVRRQLREFVEFSHAVEVRGVEAMARFRAGSESGSDRGTSSMMYSMTTNEAADKLGITPRAVIKRGANGQLGRHRDESGRWHWDRAEVEKAASA